MVVVVTAFFLNDIKTYWMDYLWSGWPFFDPGAPQNAKVTKNDKNEFSGQKNHFDHMRITILHQIC